MSGTTGSRWRRQILIGLAILLAILMVVPPALLGGLAWLTLPGEQETPRIPGLSAPVDIAFDGEGVPFIRATTDRDAAAALGWAHARDRMFQMDLMRRAASGRLSELAGSATLQTDRMMRLFGLARLAEGDLAAQTPETRALLDAYAAGVNAWIAARGRFAAPEFALFGAPAPWRPADSLLWGRTMGLWLSGNYRAELAREAMRGHVPDALIADLWPPSPTMPPAEAAREPGRDEGAAQARRTLAALPAWPEAFTLPPTASNEWAVDGRHTVSGAPLLAGDPHLNFGFPGLWYLARIEVAGHVLAGATAPGVPFLIMGHNERIAWTFTTTGADTQDVYLEPPGTAFTTREERIKVRGAPDNVLTVRESRHGPVISDLTGTSGPPLAVAMTNLQPGSTAPSGLVALNHAGSVAEAGRTAALITAPVQNLMVADARTIGLFVTGRVPVRQAGDGWAPVPGGSGGSDPFGWTGFAEGTALPHAVAPASGRLVNTNEPVARPDFPVFMGRDVFRDWRSQRARALLEAKPRLTAADFAAMQRDTVSPYAVAVLPVLRAVPGVPSSFAVWDGSMNEDDARPLIFATWMAEFRKAVLAATGVQDAIRQGGVAPPFDFVPHVLSPAGAHFCGGNCTPLLKQALERTMSALAARFGPDPAQWRWGWVHQAEFAHPFLRTIPLLGSWTTATIPVPGDGATLDRGGMDKELASVHGAAYRGVYDLGNLDGSLFVVAPGQSGNPFSRDAWNFLTRWHDNDMVRLGQAPAAVSATARLTP